MNRLILLLLLSVFTFPAFTQYEPQPDASEILVKLKKLNFLGSVLYVAAHPDDENTRLIAYLENSQYARVAYLSLTRGDGGQNLIGPEIREGLGLIRTQELLAARRIDGGDQFFSRANDFGYSKNAEETLKIWNREEVLSDVVKAYRKFRPDVIITRFPPDERAGHGHHTSSAIMAEAAFDLSGKKTAYPGQLDEYYPWQPKRLFTNTGRWWNPDMTGQEPGVVTVDAGAYNALLGESMTEIAARSRSQHKSQGFGATGSRGEALEFLEFVKGDQADDFIFEGVDTSWSRVSGGNEIGKSIDAIIDSYDPINPSAIVPQLVEVRTKIAGLQDEFWRTTKLTEIDNLIASAAGLYLEARASEWRLHPGQEVEISLEAVNRSDASVTLQSIEVNGQQIKPESLLSNNQRWEAELNINLPADMEYTQPYWLREPGSLGMYRVNDPDMIGKPQNDPAMQAAVELLIEHMPITFRIPVRYKWNDPVKGEQSRPLVVAPPAVVNIPTPVFLFSSGKTKTVDVTVMSYLTDQPVEVGLSAGDGWKIQPATRKIEDLKPGEEQTIQFEITPPAEQQTATLKASVEINGKTYVNSQVPIEYDHFPAQMLLPEATSKLVNIPIRKYGNRIGYIQGAGDAIPETLRELGYEVREMNDAEVTQENLEVLDAVILGVRALNTNEGIASYMDELLDYTYKGGTLIVQYNTNFRLKTEAFAPFPIGLSRLRVADETAPVEVLAPSHPVMNEPNVILPEDFDNWVQERGLYFPESWDNAYTPILASHDPGEEPLQGGLLVAKYGQGHYVYTGYSWFRELPAGVTGAIKLFTNMVSLGNGESTSDLND